MSDRYWMVIGISGIWRFVRKATESSSDRCNWCLQIDVEIATDMYTFILYIVSSLQGSSDFMNFLMLISWPDIDNNKPILTQYRQRISAYCRIPTATRAYHWMNLIPFGEITYGVPIVLRGFCRPESSTAKMYRYHYQYRFFVTEKFIWLKYSNINVENFFFFLRRKN